MINPVDSGKKINKPTKSINSVNITTSGNSNSVEDVTNILDIKNRSKNINSEENDKATWVEVIRKTKTLSSNKQNTDRKIQGSNNKSKQIVGEDAAHYPKRARSTRQNCIQYKTSDIVLMGDFNMQKPNHKLKELLSLINSHGLEVTIDTFTRIRSSSKSCIDNIDIINDELYKSEVIDPCLSDHYAQLITLFNKNCKKPRSTTITIRNKSKRNMSLFIKALETTDFNFHSNDIDKSTNFLINTYSYLIEKFFPYKEIDRKDSYVPVKWFFHELRNLRNNVSILKTVSLVSKDPIGTKAYKSLHLQYKKKYCNHQKKCL